MGVERFGGGGGPHIAYKIVLHCAMLEHSLHRTPKTKLDQASLPMLVIFGNPNLDTYLLSASASVS